MKKICSVIIALILALCLGTTAFAADYYNEETEISFNLPEGYFVLYPEMTEEYYSEYSEWFNFSYSEFIDYFAEYGYACEIYNCYDSSEISMWFVDYDSTDYSEETEATLQSDLNDVKSLLDESAEIYESKIYRTENGAFLWISMKYDNNGLASQICVTVNNGKMIFIENYPYEEAFTPEQTAYFEEILDKMTFGAEFSVSEEQHSDAFEYTGKYAGVSLKVPENWSIYSETNEEEFCQLELISADETASVAYMECSASYLAGEGGDTFWTNFGVYDNFSIEDLNPEEVAEGLGIPAENVEKVTVGGMTYFKVETDYDSLLEEELWLAVNEGKAYIFMYYGVDFGEKYSDFTSIIRSAAYPVSESEPTVDEPAADEPTVDEPALDEPAEPIEKGNIILGLVIIIVPVAVLAVIIVVVIVLVKNKAKKGRGKTAAAAAAAQPIPAVPTTRGNNFCTLCGAKLKEGSSFCHECGAPVNKN